MKKKFFVLALKVFIKTLEKEVRKHLNMRLSDCPHCMNLAPEALPIMNQIGASFFVSCEKCGMSGPQAPVFDLAQILWNNLPRKGESWGHSLSAGYMREIVIENCDLKK